MQGNSPQVSKVATPSADDIIASQLQAARGLLDLQLEKFPEFTQAEGQRITDLAPITGEAVAAGQRALVEGQQDVFPEFFDVLTQLGQEASNRLKNIGSLPQDVVDQSLEQTLAGFANRGIQGPIASAGTAGQLSALGQQQRVQDLGLAQAFLGGPFTPNVSGLPGNNFVAGTPSPIIGAAQGAQLGQSAQQLAIQSEFSNRALQLSNAQLAGGDKKSGLGPIIGSGVGAVAGSFIGQPVLGAQVGGFIGGQF